MKRTGFYIIKDAFFKDMADPYLKGNKQGNRPHYYCFQDDVDGIYWMIPPIQQGGKISAHYRAAQKTRKTMRYYLHHKTR
ncbi:MAG: hypothetical protein IJT82_05450 [Schwartzia sp.]|nr:hypothetical protein [Schwartzia sp. (in: firmicutes)]